ncbi:OmpA family protein [Altererythrobacter aurantiacus]|uniref:OmpA family protein n=1 Tax=Parapontixanthobacter aurantiacus TaxID=1463599 RepID=A0A844ZFY1_9SPHN|nr:OmpA family protein [Parapontixanthobacter aurantiacus]MXO86678.1 OmpA family protein [Parapontixanthobacter aurantiacus]
MTMTSKYHRALVPLAALAVALPAGLSAQQDGYDAQDDYEAQSQDGEVLGTVYGAVPADLSGYPEGPTIEGIISARNDNKIQITSSDGSTAVVSLSDGTEIKSSGGFLGLGRDTLTADQLMNGLPVEVETVAWARSLIASRVDLKSKDLRTAAMINQGTAQGFAEQTAATEALRGRVANIDKYNVKGTTNVFFDTGKANLSSEAQADLCSAAAEADATENALMLVVGYTDSVGDYEYNQQLSERRAARVVNYLQQACGWEPYRMLTPTGMAEADPMADNETEEGKAQNRRVAVNILVSKSVDGL